MLIRSVRLSVLALVLAGAAHAQLISIRTVPVAQSDQFDVYPSHNMALGGVSIALRDPLLDPFVNPAKAMREGSGRFYGSPVLYNVSNNAGSGRTLPLAGVARKGAWFGALSLALQQVDPSNQGTGFFPEPLVLLDNTVPVTIDPPRPRGNQYAYGAVGKVLRPGLSVGGSMRWAGLNAVDGVDLLYAGSRSIGQHGSAGDVRLGLLKEWDEKSLDVLVLHNRFRMQHDVTFVDFVWDPATQRNVQVPRLQQNFDYSNAWGLHLGYQRPMSAPGWRVGGIFTGNVMSHPKLPEYDVRSVGIVPIWGDPGNSYAFNLGVGVSRTRSTDPETDDGSTFALEAVYEPIWTNTWGEAIAATPIRSGGLLPAGGKTVENWFTFSNFQFRMGVDQTLFPRQSGKIALQLGLAVHSIQYHMWQHDNLQEFWREQREGWLEWVPTWGLTFRFTDMEIRYRGRVTNGTGRPGVVQTNTCRNCAFDVVTANAGGSNILVAPTGPLTLTPVQLMNHQVSISVPIK